MIGGTESRTKITGMAYRGCVDHLAMFPFKFQGSSHVNHLCVAKQVQRDFSVPQCQEHMITELPLEAMRRRQFCPASKRPPEQRDRWGSLQSGLYYVSARNACVFSGCPCLDMGMPWEYKRGSKECTLLLMAKNTGHFERDNAIPVNVCVRDAVITIMKGCIHTAFWYAGICTGVQATEKHGHNSTRETWADRRVLQA